MNYKKDLRDLYLDINNESLEVNNRFLLEDYTKLVYDDLLIEMPINKFEKIGKWNQKKTHGYDKASLGILRSDAGVQKIKDKFDNISSIDFNLYFVKDTFASNYSEMGEISEKQLEDMLGLKVGVDIEKPEYDITVIFTNNKAAEKMPLTYWTIAHRMGHSFRASLSNDQHYRNLLFRINKLLKKILENCYDIGLNNDVLNNRNPMIRSFLESIGKFRSARTKQLPRTFEFVYESFAQWLLSDGELSYNDFPDTLNTHNKLMYGKPYSSVLRLNDQDEANSYRSELEYNFIELFDYMINYHIGKICLM